MVNTVVLFCGLKTYQIHIVLNALAGVIVTGEENGVASHKNSTSIQPVIQASQIVEVAPTIHIAIHVMIGIQNLITHVINAQYS